MSMENNVPDNPFAGSREMAEAGAGFIAYLNDRFPNAQALVDAIEDILSELCLNLTNLTDAFNTGSPEFEEKHGEHILVIIRAVFVASVFVTIRPLTGNKSKLLFSPSISKVFKTAGSASRVVAPTRTYVPSFIPSFRT